MPRKFNDADARPMRATCGTRGSPPPTSRRCWVSRATVYRHLAVDAVSRKAAPDIRAQVHATAVAALDFLTSHPRLVQLLFAFAYF